MISEDGLSYDKKNKIAILKQQRALENAKISDKSINVSIEKILSNSPNKRPKKNTEGISFNDLSNDVDAKRNYKPALQIIS